MDPLSISAGIIALLQASSRVIGYLGDVKDGPKELQRIRHEICSVLPMLSILEDEAQQAKAGGVWSSTLLSLDKQNGPIQQLRAALAQLEVKLAPVTGLKKVGKTLTWTFERNQLQRILNTIERQKLLFTLARQNDHIALSKAIKADVETSNKKINEIGEKVAKLDVDQKKHKICAWLSGPNPSSNYNEALGKRLQGTGSWLIKADAFHEWKQGSGLDRIIWLHGIPGCGKTILCSTALENILQIRDQTSDIAVLYFFFDFNVIEKQQRDCMVRSLLSQLTMQCVGSPREMNTLYDSCMEGTQKPQFEALMETFHRMAANFRSIFIVLDALDECEERSGLMADIENFISWKDLDLRILATSRREKDIEDSVLQLTKKQNRICIQSALADDDIRAYVHHQLQTNSGLQRWKEPEVITEIENTLMEKADGMFRWAACQLDQLGKCLTRPMLRKALQTLPKTLDDTYARILCNIDEAYQQYASHILQWLVFSKRPLRLTEVSEVVAIDLNDTAKFDPERRLQNPGDIVEICCSLITVTHRSSDIDNENSELYVSLAHFSVKEYLISDIIRQGPAFKFSLKETDCHVSLTKDCLAYLLHFDGIGSLTSDVLTEYPLAGYVARYWPEHARVAEKEDDTICQDLLLTKGEASVNSIRLHYLCFPHPYTRTPRLRVTNSPLSHASAAGLPESVRLLLDNRSKYKIRDEDVGNALVIASYRAYVGSVRLLHEEYIHLGTTRSSYLNSLQMTRSSNIEIERMLHRKRADISESANDALLTAIERHDEETAKHLIHNGADVTRTNHEHMDPLELASREGLQGVVELLLDQHIIPKTQGKEYSRALAEASKCNRFGSRKVVQKLLDEGAVINSEVMTAALNGADTDIMQMLLVCGGAKCDTRVRDEQGRALCHLASLNHNITMLEMLVKLEADLTVTDKQGRNCLHHATSNSNKFRRRIVGSNVLTWLLKRGFDPNIPDRDGWTPLHWAARQGNGRMIRILEDHGAHFSRESIMGWTPNDVALFHDRRISWTTSIALDDGIERSNSPFENGARITSPETSLRGGASKFIIDGHNLFCSCNGCKLGDFYTPLYGPVYQCLNCLDFRRLFRYCFKCKELSEDSHPGHTFIRIAI